MSQQSILIVDDEPSNADLLRTMLAAEGYGITVARDADEALKRVDSARPDLVVLDVVTPGRSGFEACIALRARPETHLLPVIVVTGADSGEERVRSLEAGADEILVRPVHREVLLAAVRSLLRVRRLHQQLETQALALTELNAQLEQRVSQQLAQMQRLNRLKDFFPPNVAEVILREGGEALLAPRRRQIVVCFIDMRGFTPFVDTSEPEDVMSVLSTYYAEMGAIIERHGGTVESFAGDGLTIFFNAPIEISAPERAAVRCAVEMRDRFDSLNEAWTRRGYRLGFGVGLSSGFATIGAVGFSGHWQYAAIGMVTNLAARLCSVAVDGEILAPTALLSAIEAEVETEVVGDLQIKGFSRPVAVARLRGLRARS